MLDFAIIYYSIAQNLIKHGETFYKVICELFLFHADSVYLRWWSASVLR